MSNNPYALDRLLASGTRPTLGSGQLGIVVDAPGDSPRPPGRTWSAPRLEVSAPQPVHAGVDGEAVELSPPGSVRQIRPRLFVTSDRALVKPRVMFVSSDRT